MRVNLVFQSVIIYYIFFLWHTLCYKINVQRKLANAKNKDYKTIKTIQSWEKLLELT